MKIIALDLASTTGYAYGAAGRDAKPIVGHWDIRSHHADLVPGNLAYAMRVLFKEHGVPDVMAIEQTMNPAAQKHTSTIRSQERLHGAALGVAGIYRIPQVIEVYPATARVHFCGKAHAGGRDETKAMVMKRAKQLGYPITSTDEADAIAIWDYVAFNRLKTPLSEARIFMAD